MKKTQWTVKIIIVSILISFMCFFNSGTADNEKSTNKLNPGLKVIKPNTEYKRVDPDIFLQKKSGELPRTGRGNGSGSNGSNPGNPYPDFGVPGKGSGSKGPVIGDEDPGPSGFGPPSGAQNPGDILDPEKMGPGDAGSPASNIYGNVLPGKDPRGGGRGERLGYSFDEFYLIVGLENIKDSPEKTWMVTDKHDLGDGYYMWVAESGERGNVKAHIYVITPDLRVIHVLGTTIGEAYSNNKDTTLDDSGTATGRKSPLTPEDMEIIKSAKTQEILWEILNDPPIKSSGGSPVDPKENKSDYERGSGGSSRSSGSEVPDAKKTGSGIKPGTGLIGPKEDSDRDSEGYLILPKGMHVIDPPR